MNEQLEVIEQQELDNFQSDEKSQIDSQVATAKKFPREIRRATENSIAIATMDAETAETCTYSIPRAGKNIAGPSVHLARIIAQNWQNLRVESKIIGQTHNQVISQAICFDLETNYAVKVEVRKNILQNEYKNGKPTGRKVKMNDDMIVVTGNAANAVAYRNAVFAVIPKAVSQKVYNAAKNMITGDLSSEEKLVKRRIQAIDHFKDNYKVTEEQLLEVLGLNSINQIKQDEIVRLVGLAQAIKDGDTTVKEVFDTTKKADKDKANSKTKDIADKLKETQLQELKVKDLNEARSFFENDLGIVGSAVTDDNINKTAAENGFKIVINK